jgi:hypothetical protein
VLALLQLTLQSNDFKFPTHHLHHTDHFSRSNIYFSILQTHCDKIEADSYVLGSHVQDRNTLYSIPAPCVFKLKVELKKSLILWRQKEPLSTLSSRNSGNIKT